MNATNTVNKALVPALFLHIQKTAGTSIVSFAQATYGPSNVHSHGNYLDGYITRGASLLETFRDCPEYRHFFSHENTIRRAGVVPFVSGHFGFDFASSLMKHRYSFTFLRDPVERILSFYYFCRSRDPSEYKIYQLTQEVSLNNFLKMGMKDPEVKNYIWNNQTWQLAYGYGNSTARCITKCSPDDILHRAVKHLDQFSDIGFAETFESDSSRILEAIGIKPPHAKIVSNQTVGRPTKDDLSRATLAHLEQLTQLDQALYDEAWKKNGSKLTRLKTMHLQADS